MQNIPKTEIPQVQFMPSCHTKTVVDMPVAVRDHVPMVQTAQNTPEVSLVHHIGGIADESGMMQRQVPTTQTARTQRQVLVIQEVLRTEEAPQVQYRSETVDFLVPLITVEQIAEMIKVIPQERVSERTVEQTVRVPVEIPQEQVQQRTVELEHSLEHGTDEVSEKSDAMKSGPDVRENRLCQDEWFDHGLDPRRRLIRRAL